MEESSCRQSVVIAGRLGIQHHVVRTRNAHEVVASRSRQEQQQVVSRVLVGGGVVGVADIAAHRQAQQLTHEMVFETSADDLPLVVQILRADEADYAVDEKRLEGARDSVGSRFERKLINSVMRFGGKSATLAGFEVHHVVANPSDIGRESRKRWMDGRVW